MSMSSDFLFGPVWLFLCHYSNNQRGLRRIPTLQMLFILGDAGDELHSLVAVFPLIFATLLIDVKIVCRVERSVEAQVPEAALDGRQQRQPFGSPQRVVLGSCHRRRRHEGTCEEQGRSTTAVQRTASATPHVRQPGGFHPTLPSTQTRAAASVAH